MNRLKLFLPLLLVLLLGIGLFFGLQQDPHQLGLTQQDKPMPAFIAENLSAEQQSFSQQDFKGHITLLNVWASWCPACKSEFPFLQQLNHRPDIKLYGLNYRDNRRAAQGVLNTLGNPFLGSIYDPEGKLALELGVYGTPETYLIDSHGIIRYRYAGELNQDVWQKEFQPKIAVLQKLSSSTQESSQ
ncbi:DsbE family thiol:disulfide interchange protein [Pragia fontium]|uniref:Thiol:disulfide interchange protein DsbE n=1 Tax=Pragia fontium DSM 5563 = ATCC 49100 TaxID=1122977 RepID=A0AAJ4WCF3_9GAMM|nr:DsbE family thiol:disulfide interchange protein [Pragia fontium]SFD20389.1 cytochrome c biogenesis protein CcmG, thiol:disulfide interchange protein DsbE [Pragia fontium DSM 5563 = ATCC 49100]VEJ57004.1 Cytochrome c biogenesis protein CcmG [Pragia fontium]